MSRGSIHRVKAGTAKFRGNAVHTLDQPRLAHVENAVAAGWKAARGGASHAQKQLAQTHSIVLNRRRLTVYKMPQSISARRLATRLGWTTLGAEPNYLARVGVHDPRAERRLAN
jgi:hypothetical protein